MSLREPPMMMAVYDCGTQEQTIREFTQEEYDAFDEQQKNSVQHEEQEPKKNPDAASGRQKLLDLGLSERGEDVCVGRGRVRGAGS